MHHAAGIQDPEASSCGTWAHPNRAGPGGYAQRTDPRHGRA